MFRTEQHDDVLGEILIRQPSSIEGGVLDFAGGHSYRLASGHDELVSDWLVANRNELSHAYQRLWGGDPEGFLANAARRGLSESDIREALAWGDFLQIYNDLGVIQDGVGESTETGRFLMAESDLGADSLVLDVGCSCGRHLHELLAKSPRRLIGVDLNYFAQQAGAKAWKARGLGDRILFVCSDALQLPFKPGCFTQVNTFATLDLLPARAALAEFKRVLRPGGRLVMTVEGMGVWRKSWDNAWSGRRRLNLIRDLAGAVLLDWGLDWQRGAFTRKLSAHTQYRASTITSLVTQAGFELEKCEILREYKGLPWIIGLVAKKPDPSPVRAALA